jgi:hypothetical protein
MALTDRNLHAASPPPLQLTITIMPLQSQDHDRFSDIEELGVFRFSYEQ